jgi:multimeric flavodoxin WrbA
VIRILGISASPRRGSTEFCVQKALQAAESIGGVETKFISLRGKEIKPCLHCDSCFSKGRCIYDDDAAQIIDEFFQADGVIIGSPVYDMNISSQLAALFNRFRMRFNELCNQTPRALEYKVAGALAVGGSRNGGQEMTIGAILNFCMTEGMIIVGGEKFQNTGACIWSNDKKISHVNPDEIGLEAARGVGRRVAQIASLIKKGIQNGN